MKQMYLRGYALLIGASMFATFGAQAMEPLYSQDFGTEASFKEMTVIDANNDGTKWLYDSANQRARIVNNAQNAMNDWLITPGLELKAGNSYKVSFDAIPQLTRFYTERIEVKWGTEATAAGMKNTLLAPTDLVLEYDNDGYVFHFEETIEPETDGTYYIGFHGISDRDMCWLAVDNIKVDAPVGGEMPNAPTSFVVTPILDGSAKVDIAFNAPAESTVGNPISALTKLEITRNDEVIKTFDNPTPGKAFTYTDTSAERGRTIYRARAYNESGAGKEAVQEVFVDISTPSPALWVKAEETGKEGQVTITWGAPTTDLEGRTIDPAALSYDICTTDGYYATDIVTGWKGALSYTYNALLPGDEQQFMQWAVIPTYKGEYDINHVTRCEPVAVGQAYELPFEESFPGASETTILSTVVDSDEGMWGVFDDKNDFGILAQDGDGGFTGFYTEIEGDKASMTLGKVSLNGAQNPALSFYAYNLEGMLGAVLDVVEIEIGCDGEWDEVKTFALEELPLADRWNRMVVDLSDYVGKTIQVRFNITVQNGGLVLFDKIRIAENYDYDLGVTGISAPAIVGPDAPFNIDVTVANLGAKASGEYTVYLYCNAEEVDSKSYNSLAAGAEQVVSFNETVTVAADTRMRYYAEVDLNGDSDLDNNRSQSTTVELTVTPFPTPVNLNGEKNADDDIELTWEQPDYTSANKVKITESFETAESWAIDSVDSWKFIDGDNAATGAMGYDYPGKREKHAYQVFDARHQSFAGENGFEGSTGDKYLVSFYTANGTQNDDWAISPELNGEAQTISVAVSSFDDNYLESFEVLASSTGVEKEDFTLVGEAVENVPARWSKYTFSLPEGTKYFAVRHTSTDKYMFMLDDVTFSPLLLSKDETHLGYNVYRDGKRINKSLLSEAKYVDTEHLGGMHTYAVSAMYQRGESPVSNLCIIEHAEAGISDVSADSITHIDVVDNTIHIRGAKAPVAIFSIDGRVVAQRAADENIAVAVNPGVYVVASGTAKAKLIVR